MKKGIIIQASSRSNGNTHKVVSFLKEQTGVDVVDLNQKTIAHYDYEYNNQDDDFKPLLKEIVSNYETILFATPVYWYTMSGLLKVFFDRLSDAIRIEKELGRQLRGMEMMVVSNSDGDLSFEGFAMPFKQSANYLGMTYLGHVHTWLENEMLPENIKDSLTKLVIKETNGI